MTLAQLFDLQQRADAADAQEQGLTHTPCAPIDFEALLRNAKVCEHALACSDRRPWTPHICLARLPQELNRKPFRLYLQVSHLSGHGVVDDVLEMVYAIYDRVLRETQLKLTTETKKSRRRSRARSSSHGTGSIISGGGDHSVASTGTAGRQATPSGDANAPSSTTAGDGSRPPQHSRGRSLFSRVRWRRSKKPSSMDTAAGTEAVGTADVPTGTDDDVYLGLPEAGEGEAVVPVVSGRVRGDSAVAEAEAACVGLDQQLVELSMWYDETMGLLQQAHGLLHHARAVVDAGLKGGADGVVAFRGGEMHVETATSMLLQIPVLSKVFYPVVYMLRTEVRAVREPCAGRSSLCLTPMPQANPDGTFDIDILLPRERQDTAPEDSDDATHDSFATVSIGSASAVVKLVGPVPESGTALSVGFAPTAAPAEGDAGAGAGRGFTLTLASSPATRLEVFAQQATVRVWVLIHWLQVCADVTCATAGW